jgi:hypothetical protein
MAASTRWRHASQRASEGGIMPPADRNVYSTEACTRHSDGNPFSGFIVLQARSFFSLQQTRNQTVRRVLFGFERWRQTEHADGLARFRADGREFHLREFFRQLR